MEGLIFIGDTTIGITKYSDMYRFYLSHPGAITNLEINRLFISKKKGLIAFKTGNGVNWYLYP